MAERTATWKVLADFSKVRREAKKTRQELEALQHTREQVNESTVSSNDEAARSDDAAAKATQRSATSQQKSLGVLQRLSAARRRAAAETRTLTDAEKVQIASSESVVRAQKNVESALLSRQRANLALESSQRRLADVEKKHGSDSDQYARALLSVSRATLEADAADRRHVSSVERLSTATRDAERSVRGLDGGGKGLIGTLAGVAGGFGRATFSAKLFGGSLRTLGIVALIPGISLLVTWLSQLSAGAVAVIGPLTRMAGVLASLPQAFSIAGGAIGTFMAAFSGIGDALKQGVAAQQNAGQEAKKLGEAEADAAYQIKMAERGVRDAREAAAESARQNARAVMLAERQIAAALYESRQAHKDLITTREDERRNLQDLMNSLKDLELQERGAALSVEEARKRLKETMLDPGANDLAKQQAQLAYEEALQRLDEVKKDKDRAEKDNKKAQAKGVEGSDAVLAAKKRERDANVSLADSEYALAEARRQQAKDARDSAEAIADAQHNLAMAHRAANDAQTQATSAAYKYQQALDQLSPAGQRFVKLLMGMRDEWKKLKFAAQEGLLPGLGRALTTMLKLMPLAQKGLFDFGRIMGNTAERGANMLTSGPFTKMFGRLLTSNEKILRMAGRALLNVVSALVYLADAARPFTEWLAKTITGWTKFWKASAKAGNEQGTIAKYLDKTRKVLEILGGAFKNLWGAFKNIGKAGSDLGMDLLKSFRSITKGWKDWTGSLTGQSQLKEWFDNARPALHQTSKLLGAIMRGFFDLGRKNSVAPLIKSIRTDLGPALYDIMENLQGDFGQAIVDIISGIARMVAALTKAGSGGLTTFARTVADVVNTLADFIENNPAVQSALSGLLKGLGVLAALNFLSTILGLRKIIGLLTGGKGLAKIATTVLRPLAAGLLGLSAPVLAVVAAVAALAIGGVILYKKWKPFHDFVNKLASSIKDKLLDAWDKLKPSLMEVKDAWDDLVKSGKKGEGLIGTVEDLWKMYKKFATFMVTKVWPILFKIYGYLGGKALDILVDMVKGVAKMVTGFIKLIDGLFKFFHGLFTGDWQEMWDGAKEIVSGLLDFIIGAFKFVTAPLKGVLKALWKAVVKVFEWGVKQVVSFFKNAWDIVKWIMEPFTKVPGLLKSAWGKIKDTVSEALDKIGTTIKDFISDKIGDLVDAFKAIPGKLRDLGGLWKDAASFLLESVLNGLKVTGGWLQDFATKIYNAIKGVVDQGIDFLNDTLEFDFKIHGVGFHVDPPDIPHLPEAGILRRNRGGGVPGQGNRDTVPALLTPGEFVLRQDAVKRIGVGNLHALNEGRTPRKYARGGQVDPYKRKRRNRKYPDSPGDQMMPVQKFHRGGVVLGMKQGAKGLAIKALEALTGKPMDGTWDPAVTRALKKSGATSHPAWAFNHDAKKDKKLLDWVNNAEVKHLLRDQKHTVTKGETVREILKDSYGKRYEKHLAAFLKANNFYDSKKVKHSHTEPGTPGGASDALVRALKFARAQAGKPYIWGGVGPRGYDCSGYQSAITNVIKGNSPYHRLFDTDSMAGALPNLGFRSGLGGPNDYSVGWYTGSPGHTAGTLGTLNVESTGTYVRNGSAARGAGAFPNKAHLALGRSKGSGPHTVTTTDTVKKARYNLGSVLKAGMKVTLPDVDLWKGARTWGQARERFGVSGNQLVMWLRDIAPQFNKLDKRKTSGLSKGLNQQGGILSSALQALNTRMGLGKGSPYAPANGMWDEHSAKALDHVLAHTFKRKHDDLAFRPWKAWTPVEQAIINQQQHNDREQKWEAALGTIATWGFEDLLNNLLDKGVDDEAGFNTALSAAKDKKLAKQLNDAIKAGGSFESDDIKHILQLIGFLNGTGKGKGLREVARHLGLSDYNVVKLWQDGNKAGKFNNVPATNRTQLDRDIMSYNAGTYYFADGGQVPGVGNRDSVPAMLTPGEFVIKKQAAKALGLNNLWALNNLQKFAGGGMVMGPDVRSIPTNATYGVSQRRLAHTTTNITNNYNTTYDVDINNPIAEKSTRSMTKMLQRQSALGRKDDI